MAGTTGERGGPNVPGRDTSGPDAPVRNTLGETIRGLRKKAGLTQEQLAEGICSPVSISRIENGRQMPSRPVLDALLARLGSGTYQLCDVYWHGEREGTFRRAAEEVRDLVAGGDLAAARERLSELEDLAEGPADQQLCAMLRASVDLADDAGRTHGTQKDAPKGAQKDPRQDPQAHADGTLALLERALRLTQPGIDLTDFRHTLLSVREANVILVMVAALSQAGRRVEAIRLAEELESSLARQESTLSDFTVLRIDLAYNQACLLEEEGRYEEMLACARRAEELSLASAEQVLLPEILFLKARALHHLGVEDEPRTIVRAVAPYMELIGRRDLAAQVRAFAEKELGEKFV